MQEKKVQEVHVGGSLEQALTGNYQLSPAKVIKESWQLTLKHFFSFVPSILILLIVVVGIFYLALKMKLGDLTPLVELARQLQSDTSLTEAQMNEMLLPVLDAFFIANLSYEIITAPLYAGVCLMGMSHAVGLATKPSHILRGLQFTLPIIVMTVFSMLLQGIAGMIFALISLYVVIALGQANLLICEKRLPPLKAMLVSFKAVNKKFSAVLMISLFGFSILALSIFFSGFPLIFTLPWFFHLKGVLYRDMFGVRLHIHAPNTHSEDSTASSSEHSHSQANKADTHPSDVNTSSDAAQSHVKPEAVKTSDDKKDSTFDA